MGTDLTKHSDGCCSVKVKIQPEQDSRWNGGSRRRNDPQKCCCDSLDILLILFNILSYCLARIQIETMLWWQRSHGLDEGKDETSEIIVTVNFGEGRQKPGSCGIASKQSSLILCNAQSDQYSKETKEIYLYGRFLGRSLTSIDSPKTFVCRKDSSTRI